MSRKIKVPTLLASGVLAGVLSVGSLAMGSGVANADGVCVGPVNVGWPGHGVSVDVDCYDNYGWRDDRPRHDCDFGCGHGPQERATWQPCWWGPAPWPARREFARDFRGEVLEIFVRDDYPGRPLQVINHGGGDLTVLWS